MALRLCGKDPDCPGNNCPAVYRDDQTGDFYFQGDTVLDPARLAEISPDGPIPDAESVVKLPARMVEIIVEASHAGVVR